jgi:hypothetical protein
VTVEKKLSSNRQTNGNSNAAKSKKSKKTSIQQKPRFSVTSSTERFCRKVTGVILHLIPFFLLIQDIVVYFVWRLHK